MLPSARPSRTCGHGSPRSEGRRWLRGCSSRQACSSRMAKCGGMPASSGKRCSRRSQKAWMVCTLRPPGVSMAWANSCARALALVAAGARPSSCDSSASSAASAHRHPAGEALKTRLRHLGGGGLGVGEAEDALGRRAGEQQAQHAHGEHVRLAGAGVGRDPGGDGGIGRAGCKSSVRRRSASSFCGVRATAMRRPPRCCRSSTRRRARGGRNRHSRS